MAIAFGAGIGEVHTIGGATTKAMTTDASVPSGGKIILNIGWFADGSIVSSVAGGGLSWTIDKQNDGGTNTWYQVGIVSADAPAGLASGTTITATFSSAMETTGMAAYYITGAATASPVDAVGGAGYVSTGTVATANVVTTNANDFIASMTFVDSLTSLVTPASGFTESYGVNHADSWKLETCHQVVASTGTYAVGCSWTGSFQWVVAGVAYKASGGGGGSPPSTVFLAPTRSTITLA